MLKKIGIFTALLFSFSVLATEDITSPIDSLSESVESQSRVESEVLLEGVSFSFENDKDTNTLVPFEYGSLEISWKGISESYPHKAIRYREIGTKKWSSKSFEHTDSMLVLEGLTENLLWEYQLGSGSSKKNIEYSETIHHFNTISYSIFSGNNSAKGKTEGVKISWAIAPGKISQILEVYPKATYILKYNTKIGADQHKNDSTMSHWEKVKAIPIMNTVSHEIKELTGGEKYVYKVGLDLGDQIIWSKKGKFETERAWGLFKTLFLIGALGLFIYGMKVMSEGLQQAAGSRLRNMLGKITSNRFKGVITGFGITSVVQSSSVTTVMVVSFVNAGLMTLKQSVGVMMGANIGTTMTAWLILVFGFKVDIAAYAFILMAFGAPLLFISRGKAKAWANVIIGFCLLFMGLAALKDAVPTLSADSALVQFFVEYKNSGFLGTLMFVGLGTLVTVIIQSSSAAMALTMTMVAGGVLPFEVAAAMILGENIGTTITAQLAALIGNVHAKRAARIHAFFNLIGVCWAVIAFHFFLDGIAYFMEKNPFKDPEAANLGIAIFHTTFNIANVILLIWFVPRLVSMAEKSVRSRGSADEEFKLDYIGTGMMGTPDLSILEAKKEIAKFGKLTTRMSGFTQKLLTEQNVKAKNKLRSKISKYEEITDRVEIEVANYLAKVSEGEMSEETARRVRAMNSIVNDLERIGDVFYQMSKEIERKDERKIYFLPEQRSSMMEMFGLVDKSFEIMVANLEADWGGVSINEALEAERNINFKRDQMRKEHLENLNKKGFNMQSGMVFNNLFSSCEKIGDHIINVSEAIVGEI
ncbi:MAG: Na/Pi cotransporter family protein [Flavobacteriales bacterium]|nr:Na/Pi cotransporter family protein [Flavobacteriales bacterium]